MNCCMRARPSPQPVQYPQTDRNKEELGASSPPAVQQGSVYQGKSKTSSDFAPVVSPVCMLRWGLTPARGVVSSTNIVTLSVSLHRSHREQLALPLVAAL